MEESCEEQFDKVATLEEGAETSNANVSKNTPLRDNSTQNDNEKDSNSTNVTKKDEVQGHEKSELIELVTSDTNIGIREGKQTDNAEQKDRDVATNKMQVDNINSSKPNSCVSNATKTTTSLGSTVSARSQFLVQVVNRMSSEQTNKIEVPLNIVDKKCSSSQDSLNERELPIPVIDRVHNTVNKTRSSEQITRNQSPIRKTQNLDRGTSSQEPSGKKELSPSHKCQVTDVNKNVGKSFSTKCEGCNTIGSNVDLLTNGILKEKIENEVGNATKDENNFGKVISEIAPNVEKQNVSVETHMKDNTRNPKTSDHIQEHEKDEMETALSANSVNTDIREEKQTDNAETEDGKVATNGTAVDKVNSNLSNSPCVSKGTKSAIGFESTVSARSQFLVQVVSETLSSEEANKNEMCMKSIPTKCEGSNVDLLTKDILKEKKENEVESAIKDENNCSKVISEIAPNVEKQNVSVETPIKDNTRNPKASDHIQEHEKDEMETELSTNSGNTDICEEKQTDNAETEDGKFATNGTAVDKVNSNKANPPSVSKATKSAVGFESTVSARSQFLVQVKSEPLSNEDVHENETCMSMSDVHCSPSQDCSATPSSEQIARNQTPASKTNNQNGSPQDSPSKIEFSLSPTIRRGFPRIALKPEKEKILKQIRERRIQERCINKTKKLKSSASFPKDKCQNEAETVHSHSKVGCTSPNKIRLQTGSCVRKTVHLNKDLVPLKDVKVDLERLSDELISKYSKCSHSLPINNKKKSGNHLQGGVAVSCNEESWKVKNGVKVKSIQTLREGREMQKEVRVHVLRMNDNELSKYGYYCEDAKQRDATGQSHSGTNLSTTTKTITTDVGNTNFGEGTKNINTLKKGQADCALTATPEKINLTPKTTEVSKKLRRTEQAMSEECSGDKEDIVFSSSKPSEVEQTARHCVSKVPCSPAHKPSLKREISKTSVKIKSKKKTAVSSSKSEDCQVTEPFACSINSQLDLKSGVVILSKLDDAILLRYGIHIHESSASSVPEGTPNKETTDACKPQDKHNFNNRVIAVKEGTSNFKGDRVLIPPDSARLTQEVRKRPKGLHDVHSVPEDDYCKENVLVNGEPCEKHVKVCSDKHDCTVLTEV